MKVFVTGVNGQLGHDVMNELARRGDQGFGSDLKADYTGIADGTAVTQMPYYQLNIINANAVNRVITTIKPDAIIHCAAWTAVDKAEEEPSLVRKINVNGTQNIANVAKKLDIPMIYLSTDYVFDGRGTKPWQADFKGFKPQNVYGQTKLDGENVVVETLKKYFIVRIAWVFGINGHNFIKTMLKVGANHSVVRVVNDQIGTPTYTFDLSRLLVDMIKTHKYGYYHATNSELPATESGYNLNGTKTGYISWYDFAKEIYRRAGYKTKVIPVTTTEYGLSKARRPYNSRLDKSKLTANDFQPLPTWPDAVKRYLMLLRKQGFFTKLGKN